MIAAECLLPDSVCPSVHGYAQDGCFNQKVLGILTFLSLDLSQVPILGFGKG
jgi:hypothetical protein